MSPFSGLTCETVDSVGQENLTVVRILQKPLTVATMSQFVSLQLTSNRVKSLVE